MDHQEILQKIIARNIDQAEVYFSVGSSLQIDVANQKVESIDEARDQGIGIRVIKNKRLGFAYTSDLDPDVIEETIDQAIANANNSAQDEFLDLPKNLEAYEPKGLKAYRPIGSLVDNAIGSTNIQDKIKIAIEIEKSAYAADPRIKKTEKVSYSDSEGEVWIVNSNGVNVNYRSNSCGGSGQVIAEQAGEMEAGFGLGYHKKFSAIDPQKIGREAAQHAAELLGANTIHSQIMPIVLDPFIAVELLEVLIGPLTSEAVQKGKSLFAGKVGQLVASNKLTIIDNGLLKDGLATAPFDSEGVPTQETILLENGVLKTFLFNTYTANKGKTKSTGNARRGGFSGGVSVGPTNFYIHPGKSSNEQIIKSVNHGLYVTWVMGVHTANPISGDFSFGVSGLMIEDGKKTYPVKGITIAGNIIDLLKHIEEIGSDLRFFGSAGAPTILIANISVSGH